MNAEKPTDLTLIAPNELIRAAMAPEVSPEKLRELLAVRREWDADEGRKAYNAAIAEFQRTAPIIAKEDKGEKSNYAALDTIWREIRPLLTNLGLSVTWQVCELKSPVVEGAEAICHLEGALGHKLGHREKLVFDLPLPGVIKNKEGRAVTNVAQMMGSAVSYAKRYAICAALGVVTGIDDDAGAAGGNRIDPDEAREVADLIDACRGVGDFNEQAFWKWAGATRADEITVNRLADVLAMLNRKLGKMKA